MKRMLVFGFGLASYLLFFACFVYTVGFLADFAVPKTVDSGVAGNVWVAALVNIGLLGVFGLQHSVMARPAFKRWLTRFIPEPAERSTYVLLSVAAIALVFAAWQPMTGIIWNVEAEIGRTALWTLYLGGFGLIFYSTVLISHFDLFGLRQVTLYLQKKEYTHLPFATPSLYKTVRHPLYVGWMVAFWATPTMTLGHLLFAAVSTGYIFVALIFEEHDLIQHFGEKYTQYQEQVPAFIPRLRNRRSNTPASAGS